MPLIEDTAKVVKEDNLSSHLLYSSDHLTVTFEYLIMLIKSIKYMRGDLNETVERLNKLEGKDGDKWDKFKWLIVTGLVTLILGYLAVSVGLK